MSLYDCVTYVHTSNVSGYSATLAADDEAVVPLPALTTELSLSYILDEYV